MGSDFLQLLWRTKGFLIYGTIRGDDRGRIVVGFGTMGVILQLMK